MPTEVFANPTAKQVIFQIMFPSMFSIESKIGEFQDKIIGRFPESNQVFHRQIIFADTGVEGKIEAIPQGFSPQSMKKIWQFRSADKIEVDVQIDSLTITSQEHKSYNNPNSKKRFKEDIEFVLDNFFQTINIPIIKRIGLRYSDECPLPRKDNETLKRLYNPTFQIDKFDLSNTESVYVKIVTTRKNHKLIYQEAVGKNQKGEDEFILDFDGFEINVPSRDYLAVTDELHDIVSEEYFSIIKEPIKEYMRT